MAGTPLVGSKQTIFQEDVDFNSSASEALMTKIAQAALFGQDSSEFPVHFRYDGFFRATSISDDANTHIITADSEIRSYVITTTESGVGVNEFDIIVYDETGTSLGSLWSANPTMTAVSNSNDHNYVGRDIVNSVDLKNTVGLSGSSVGTIGSVSLLKGYQLKSKIVTNGTAALNGSIQLVLGRL